MTTHTFTLACKGITHAALAEGLEADGVDDVTLFVTCEGVVWARFSRPAPTRKAALLAALRQLQLAGVPGVPQPVRERKETA